MKIDAASAGEPQEDAAHHVSYDTFLVEFSPGISFKFLLELDCEVLELPFFTMLLSLLGILASKSVFHS